MNTPMSISKHDSTRSANCYRNTRTLHQQKPDPMETQSEKNPDPPEATMSYFSIWRMVACQPNIWCRRLGRRSCRCISTNMINLEVRIMESIARPNNVIGVAIGRTWSLGRDGIRRVVWWLRGAGRIIYRWYAGPITTKIDVQDQLLWREELGNIACSSQERSCRRAPGRDIQWCG